MTWLDDLSRVTLPDGRRVVGASFRGVPFLVDSSDRTGGRRTVVHEFPGRDVPFVEELGRTARAIRVDGYVIGEDIAAQRDALLAALEDVAGPGELVHPRYGRLRAICSNLTVREAVTEGRIVRFQISFQIQPDEPVAPIEIPDTQAEVDTAGAEVDSASAAELADDYDASAAPGYAVASLQAELVERTQAVRDALGRVAQTTAELATLELEANSLVGQAAALIRSPTAALDAFVTVLDSFTETLTAAPDRVFDALLEAYAWPDQPAVLGSSAIKLAEAANLAALTGALKRALITKAARVLVLVAFETTADARLAVDSFVELLDAQAAAADDLTFGTLQDLRGAVTRAVPGDAVLARVFTTTRSSDVPSLLLTYQLYGSVDRESELLERNAIPDPAFISGTIEALSL